MLNFMNFRNYDFIVSELRNFFKAKSFVEVPSQSNLSILSACEDPRTVQSFSLGGEIYPLPQTGQMVLEEVLLENSDIDGVFCVTTSYRDEPVLIEGRHKRIFPMFEFEGRGNILDLQKIESDLLVHLGFSKPNLVDYNECCEKYSSDILEAEHELRMQQDFGDELLLKNFPVESHPFWNMKYRGRGIFNKIDVILCGMETIGSAERSCDAGEMRRFFHEVSDGEYANLLFGKFGRQRVLNELNSYLSNEMIPRYGGGIGVTRLERAMKCKNII